MDVLDLEQKKQKNLLYYNKDLIRVDISFLTAMFIKC